MLATSLHSDKISLPRVLALMLPASRCDDLGEDQEQDQDQEQEFLLAVA
jgi:hypothetical protein